jgi:hypothetical protein
MSGIAELALGAAPVAGGAVLGSLLGTLKGPDLRASIKADVELLEKIPAEDAGLRAVLKRTIDSRIEELIEAVDRSRQLRLAAGSYKGNWRDIVVFVCALLFTVVWWYVPHSRSNWLITFVCLLILSALVGWLAARGVIRVVRRHTIRHR